MAVAMYPRVLIVALGRINAADNFNNGLLLRNLFARWPRENLAQIYSSGDNGDAGFFGHYYQLGPQDRRLGRLFYRMRSEVQEEILGSRLSPSISSRESIKSKVLTLGKRWLFDTGLYELIFCPRISYTMGRWVQDFKPDIIFAQGYNLAFTWLPLMLAERYGLPMVYYPTDDWPSNLYRPVKSFGIRHWMHRIVQYSARRLVQFAKVKIAFNPLMQKEYQMRYQCDFIVLMHGDDWQRFRFVEPRRLCPEDVHWIVSTGVFDSHRLPLLADLEQACQILSDKGSKVKATIFPVNYQAIDLSEFRFVEFYPCPSHEELPALLKGADVLFLPERFDNTVEDVRLSVSSKSHLFMFSGRPIVVYADFRTGIAQYAAQEGWGEVVGQRDPLVLASTLANLFSDKVMVQTLASRAQATISKYHDLHSIHNAFEDAIRNTVRTHET